MSSASLGFALASAAAYGVGDFLGGLASRKAALMAVLVLSRLASVIIMALAAWMLGDATLTASDVRWGVGAGCTSALAIGLFYWCLSRGAMTVVAPITAVCALVLPVLVGLATNEAISWPQGFGIALAGAAVSLVSRSGRDQAVRTPRLVIFGAIGAGIAFGVYYVAVKHMSSDAGLWPLVITRVTAFSLCVGVAALMLRKGSFTAALPGVLLALLAGSVEAGADIAYWAATRDGLLSISATLSSLYPATTIMLAMVILRERLSAVQTCGLALAVGAVALLSQG